MRSFAHTVPVLLSLISRSADSGIVRDSEESILGTPQPEIILPEPQDSSCRERVQCHAAPHTKYLLFQVLAFCEPCATDTSSAGTA